MITRSKYDTSLSTFIWSQSTILGKNSCGKCEPSGFASQVVEVAPPAISLFVCGFTSTMRCTCSDLSHCLMDFLRLSLILHLPLKISRTTQDTDTDSFDASGDDGEPASRHKWTSRYTTITADHSVTQAQEHQKLDRS
jgi:hypothetical protein